VILANHPFAERTLNPVDENGNRGCAICGRPPSVHRSEIVPLIETEEKVVTNDREEFRQRLAAPMDRHKSVLDRLAAADNDLSTERPVKHERLTTGRTDDGKVDMCSCGEMADTCYTLGLIEGRFF
jgi:hypothetical protein